MCVCLCLFICLFVCVCICVCFVCLSVCLSVYVGRVESAGKRFSNFLTNFAEISKVTTGGGNWILRDLGTPKAKAFDRKYSSCIRL